MATPNTPAPRYGAGAELTGMLTGAELTGAELTSMLMGMLKQGISDSARVSVALLTGAELKQKVSLCAGTEDSLTGHALTRLASRLSR